MSPSDGPAAVDMMMHAVGHMERHGRYTREPYRNHFCASSEDMPAWEVLVSMGLATCRRVEIPGCETTYFVTKAGLAFLRELRKAEKAAPRLRGMRSARRAPVQPMNLATMDLLAPLVVELYADEELTREELRDALTRVDDELRGLEEPARDARPRRERLAEVDTLARAWEAATGPERRAIVRELAASVAVSPGCAAPVWRS